VHDVLGAVGSRLHVGTGTANGVTGGERETAADKSQSDETSNHFPGLPLRPQKMIVSPCSRLNGSPMQKPRRNHPTGLIAK
jgi:hypothetical protein